MDVVKRTIPRAAAIDIPSSVAPPCEPAALFPVVDRGEQKLLRAACKGDRAAFATIVEQHQRTVFAYLRTRVTDAADAEDMCQEVFLRLYVGRKKLTPQIVLRAWLLGIARNLLRERVRRLRRTKEVAWTELCLEIESLVETEDRQYDDAMAVLPECLQSLGESAREALELRYRGDVPLCEIATRFRRSEGAIKLLLYRARQALKRCLDAKLLGQSHE
jgi:RNA polymerase sigma-70 factor (ECF subfamily)